MVRARIRDTGGSMGERIRAWVVGGIGLACVAGPSFGEAQTLGAFRWQTQPYCNVLTLTVTQNGGQYHLDGTDDQCGAAKKAGVVGLGFPNPDGTVGFGLTVVTAPGGIPLHIDATLSPASLGGSWRDSTGATGAFSFTPAASTGGSPRPLPRVAFPAGLSAGNATITNVGAPVADTDASTKAYVDAATAANSTADRAFSRALATRSVHLGAYALVAISGTLTPAGVSCRSLSQGGIARVAVPVPSGAILTSAQVKFFQNSAADNAVFNLYGLDMQEGAGLDAIPGGSFSTLGAGGTSHSRTWTFQTGLPPTSAIRSYTIEVRGVTATNVQMCGMEVSFTLP
jgi:hypothetical protein